MKNIESHKNKTFDFTPKTDDLEKKSKISKIFFLKIVFQKGPADSY